MSENIGETLGEITKNVIRDYYTAGIKAEVVLDMLLTPVIREILVVGGVSRVSDIENLRFGTKEFPLIKKGDGEEEGKGNDQENDQNNNSDYRSTNVDYLLWDNKTIYLVELKTTPDSINNDQITNYTNKINGIKERTFGAGLGEQFIGILNEYSNTGMDVTFEEKWANYNKNTETENKLKWLFDIIIQRVDPRKFYAKGNGVELAEEYLRNKNAYSSKKYLLQAGQLLDAGVEKIWNRKDMQIQMVYIVPNNAQDERLKAKFVENKITISLIHLEDIVKKKEEIKKKNDILKDQKVEKCYIDWLFDKILIQLFGEKTTEDNPKMRQANDVQEKKTEIKDGLDDKK